MKPPRRFSHLGHVLALGIALSLALDSASAAAPPGGYHIGLDFVTTGFDPGPAFLFDFEPFTITQPANYFVTQGAFAGWSEADVQRRVGLAVEDVFREIPGLPTGEVPAIAFHLGRVPTSVEGRRLNVAVAQSLSPTWTLLGEAQLDAYSNPGIADDSYVAAIYVDEIDALGESFLTYSQFDGALNAIAGTIAHEVGHVFGAEHVTITGSEPAPLPVMAIESTGLPTSARLSARRFDVLPENSPSNAARMLANAGTVLEADYNFDGLVDGADIGVLMSGFGQLHGLYHEGDANGDHLIDGADIGRLMANWTFSPSEMALALAAVPEPASLPLAACAALALVARRRARR